MWGAGLVEGRNADRAFLWATLTVLFVSRLIAFPGSIWDQDEANFALAVLDFDPLQNQPHAPFFPLWIGLGKLVHLIAPSPTGELALQLVSAAASVLVFVPLLMLWRRLLPAPYAFSAALVALLLPGPWLLSGRAYSEPTAAFFLVTAVACWLVPDAKGPRLLVGALAMTAAVLVRPQWVPVVAPLLAWAAIRARTTGRRLTVVLIPCVSGVVAVALVSLRCGGFGPLVAAVRQHQSYIAAAGEGFSWTFAELNLHAAVGGVGPGCLWIALAILGGAHLCLASENRQPARVFAGLVLAPHLILLLGLQNPTLVRYAVPIVLLTSGLVIAGARFLLSRRDAVFAVVGLAVIASVVRVGPALGEYRRSSPVVRAFASLASEPQGQVSGCDRRLVSFVTLFRRAGILGGPLLWGYQLELGIIAPPGGSRHSAVFSGRRPAWIVGGREAQFSVSDPTLRAVASPRFLEVTVVECGTLVKPEHPSISASDLRRGVRSLVP